VPDPARPIRYVLCLCVALCGVARVEAQSSATSERQPTRALFSVDLSGRSSFSSTPTDGANGTPQALVVDVQDGKLCVPLAEQPDGTRATTSSVSSSRPRIPTIADESIARHVADACTYYGVDSDLVKCVINQESGFSRRAVSPKGAAGYMQLMPATARRMGVADVFDARQNIWGGVRYLRYLLDLFDDDVALALAGYNAGEGRVIRAGYRVPAIRETIEYVRAIAARYGKARHLTRATCVRIEFADSPE
jgi:membrane-bound lytic murein transglycosylase B